MDYQSFQPGGQEKNQVPIPPSPVQEIPQPQNLNGKLRPYRWHIAIVGGIIIAVLFGAYSYIKYTNEQNDAAVTKQAEEAQKKIDEILQKRGQDMTATWKTYTNTQYGFEFKIPQNWIATQKNGELCFGENGKQYMVNLGIVCGVSVRVYVPGSCDVNCYSAASLIEMRNNPKEITMVGDEKAITQSENPNQAFPDIITLVDHVNKTYEIQTSVPAEVKGVYFGILSTFKFTGTSLPTPIPTATPVSDSGVSGTIIFRTCGGVFKAPPCSNEARPNVEIVIQKVADGSITRFNTSNTGTFKVSLKPGDYVIKKPDLGGLSGQDTPVKVTANNYSQVAITYSFLYP